MSEKQKIKITYPRAIVLVAVIVVIGNIIATPLSKEFQQFLQKPPNQKSTLGRDKSPLNETPKELTAAINLNANILYEAESAGFVSVYSFGDNAAHGWLKSGKSQKDVGVRTRFNKWGGATLWVRNGEYWVVTTDSADSVRVQWIPFF